MSFNLKYLKLILFLILFSFASSKAQDTEASESDILNNGEDIKVQVDKKLKEKPKKLDKKDKQILKSQKALWFAHILRDKVVKGRIAQLAIQTDKVPVYLVPKGDSFRPLVKLRIHYKRPDWILFIGEEEPARELGVPGEYAIYAYLNSRISTVQLRALGPGGEQELETLYLFAPEAREFKMVSIFDAMLFSVGHSYHVYKQSTFGTFVSQSLYLGARYLSPEKGKKLGYFGDLGLTVYTYDSSPFQRSTHYLEGRLGLTYLANIINTPKVRSRVMLGASTTNLFSFGSDFGFSGLYGPDLGFRSEYYRSGKNSFAAELHFTPYDFSDPMGERSIKFSLDWNRNLNNLRRGQIGLAYTNSIFSTDNNISIDSNLISTYFSLSF